MADKASSCPQMPKVLGLARWPLSVSSVFGMLAMSYFQSRKGISMGLGLAQLCKVFINSESAGSEGADALNCK